MAKRTSTATRTEKEQRDIDFSQATKHEGKHDCFSKPVTANCYKLCSAYYRITGGKWTNDFEARNEAVLAEVGNDAYRMMIGV